LESKIKETATLLRDKGYEVRTTDLQGKEIEAPQFDSPMSDLSGALKKITNRFENNQMGGVILASDGIYNEGISPLYSTYNFPLYTVGIGDTTQSTDVVIK